MRRLGTSGESIRQSERLVRGLCAQIVSIAWAAGPKGTTINEVGRQIQDHKEHSISPRFSELEKRGALVQVPVGRGRPTQRFPKGIPLYMTRYDEETGRNVNVYWVPEFAPTATDNGAGPDWESVEEGESDGVGTEYHE